MRKGHGSSKVPNVKLRPVPLTKPTRGAIPAEHDYEVESGEGFDATLKKPLEGIVICCTGISDKPTLLAQAKELGALHSNDYTDRITHLIANVAGSAKYQCALERNTPIMEPAWISRTYDKWLKGADISLEESERKFRLPAFQGLWIAISGEDDVHRRTALAKLISSESGRYCKEVNDRVTHLVVCSPVGTEDEVDSEKVNWARNINVQRRKQGVLPAGLIKIVWEEWLWDCQAWQGKWDEASYRIENLRPERKPSPSAPAEADFMEPPSFNDCMTSTQHFLQYETPSSGSSIRPTLTRAPTKPKLQAIEGDGAVEIANTRGAAVNGDKAVLQKGLWNEILSHASQQRSSAKSQGKGVPRRSRPKADGKLSDTEDEDEDEGPGPAPSTRPNLFAEDNNTLSSDQSQQKSFLSRVKRTEAYSTGPSLESSTSLGLINQKTLLPPSDARQTSGTTSMDGSPASSQVFSGLRLRTLGGANHTGLASMVERNGGVVVNSQPEDNLDDADFVIVRLREAPNFVSDEHPLFHKFRTECWIESCAYEERLCKPEEDVVFTPLRVPFPIPGAENIHLVWSGLLHSESHHLKQLCKVLGITAPDKFCRKTTHLICPQRQGPKYDKAIEWGVPVFNLEWVWEIARTGSLDGGASIISKNLSKAPIVDITNDPSENQRPHGQINADKRSNRQIDSPFGDCTILVDDGDKPTKPLMQAMSPTKPIRPSPLGRDNVAPTSPSKKSHKSTNVGRLTSSGSAGGLRPLASGVAALLGKHLQESPAEGSSSPPRKKARPASRAKTITDSNRASASLSPSHSSTSASFVPMPLQPVEESRFDDDDAEFGHNNAESVQVFYADPTQEAEKERFMQLIESGGKLPEVAVTAGSAKKKDATSKPPRRSARKSGF
ncbi:hypothetical protein FRB93_013015 [Tulasnella sp. JGI-2019a]|nr:hypothetical protein FRB93_013015 [Tulasnella sp. JGI-2019a]